MTEPSSGISRALVALLAVAVGASVANRFYIEPLLAEVAAGFGVAAGPAGLLVTCAQLGYVAGLALLVPLGDVRERRRLVTTLVLGAGAAAAACAVAPSLATLAVALGVLGLFSVAAQVLVPTAASLAADRQRGVVVGVVTSGLLVGVLAARTVSGLVAGVGGFRLVFALAALVMLALAAVLHRALPPSAPTERSAYRALLRSVLDLVVAEPVLRHRMLLGFLQMAGFTVFWTPSAFLLAGPPYHYPTVVIGLFGLVGVAGALTAPVAGRLGDLGRGRFALATALLVTLAAWPLLALGAHSLVALVAGIALLDLGAQAAQVDHQRAIYALRPAARGRLNTAYMIAFFLGGVTGSLLAATVYGAAGWYAVCLLGAAIAIIGLGVRAANHRNRRRSA